MAINSSLGSRWDNFYDVGSILGWFFMILRCSLVWICGWFGGGGGLKNYPKSIQNQENPIQNWVDFLIDFWTAFWCFWIDFVSQIWSKTEQNSIKKAIKLLIDFWMDPCWIFGRFFFDFQAEKNISICPKFVSFQFGWNRCRISFSISFYDICFRKP